MLDNLLTSLSAVCKELLPIFGAVALIYLCILLKHAWKLIDGVSATVDKLDPTLKKVDESIDKVQAPLDTAVKYSHTLDSVHDKAAEGIEKAAQFTAESGDKLKDFVQSKMNKKADEAVEESPAFVNPLESRNEPEKKEDENHE